MKISYPRFMFRVLLTLIGMPLYFVEFCIRWIIGHEENHPYYIKRYVLWVDEAIFE